MVLVIPPIPVNNKLVTNFKDNTNIFYDFFCKQCQAIPNSSTLPSIQTFKIWNRLSIVDIDSKKILKLIQGLNSNKTHGHGGLLLFNNSLRDSFS